jgi:methylaspartate ammonia-lyase
MTKIIKVLAVPATGAYYITDLKTLQDNPLPVGQQYAARSQASGFRCVREVAEAVSVGLVLGEDGAGPPRGDVVWGDCVGVAYAGISGRDPVLRTADALGTIRREVEPVLIGREIISFRDMVAAVDAITEKVRVPVPPEEGTDRPEESDRSNEGGFSRRDLLAAPFRMLRPEGAEEKPKSQKSVTVERPLHTAIRYGVSQALLKAVARARHLTMAEVIADEWDLPQPGRSVPIHAQSGADRRTNADKMIVRRVSSLPHALVEDIPTQLGEDGEVLVGYVRWLRERIAELGGSNYRPVVHIDVHGALGRIYENNLGRILGYLYRLESSTQPYSLRIESPVIMESRAAQIEALKTLREYAQFRNVAVQIVADEWADTLEDIRAFVDAQAADVIQIKMPDVGGLHDTVEAVLTCKKAGIGAFLGGSCAETDLAARAAVHVALATQPTMMMAKPGMGVDEAISIVKNEMMRTLVLIKARDGRQDPRRDPTS